MKRKGEEAEEIGASAKAIKASDGTVGRASYQYGLVIDDIVNSVTNSDLSQYFFDGPLPLHVIPKALILTTDFLQLQARVIWFLRHRLSLNVDNVLETTHRRMNDINLAMDETSRASTRQNALIVVNAHYGPWNGGGFHTEIKDTALDISENFNQADPILNHFWPRIVFDRRMSVEDDSAEGRSRYLKDLPNQRFVKNKTEKAANKHWGSLEHSWDEGIDEDAGGLAFLLTVWSMKKKHIKELSDLEPKSSALDGISLMADVAAGATAGAAAGSVDPVDAAPKKLPKPSSASKARQDAKASMVTDKKKCANTLHYVNKLVYDLDFIGEVREHNLLRRAELADHSYYTSMVLSGDAVREHFAKLSRFSYLEVCSKTIQTFHDVTSLERCGYICAPERAEAIQTDSPRMLLEDARTQRYIKSGINIIAHRASSLAWHSTGFPGVLAGLVWGDDSSVQASLKRIETLVAAIEWCQEGPPTDRAMAGRSLLKTGKLMGWCVDHLKAANFAAVPPLLHEFLKLFWEGLLQTVVNERLNKVARDLELRSSTSKYGACATMWYELLVATHVLENYGVKTIAAPHSEAPLPRDLDIKDLFNIKPTDFEAELNRLNSENDFQTWSSTTIKRAYHETELMVLAHRSKDRALISKSYRADFAPRGQVLLFREPKATRGFVVLWNCGGCFATWPIIRHESVIEFVIEHTEMVYRTIDDLDKVFVLPTTGVSILRALKLRKEGANVPTAMQLLIAGKPIPLMAWQFERGYAGVPEASLRKYVEFRGLAPLPADLHFVQPADQYVIQLAKSFDAKLSDKKLVELLSKRTSLEDDAGAEVCNMDDHVLDDLLSASDRQDALQKKREVKAAKLFRKTRTKYVHEVTKKVTGLVKIAREYPDIVKVRKSVLKLAKSSGDRWWNTYIPDSLLLESLKPEGGIVYMDVPNGRFRVCHRKLAGTNKSFSWGKRGPQKASAQALVQLWAWDQQVTGTPCPLPLEIVDLATSA